MNSPKYNAVNWIDGMKLSSGHFVQQADHFIERVNRASETFITAYNFGLLNARKFTVPTLSIQITPDISRMINVKLYECHAITPGGDLIDISVSQNNASAGDSAPYNISFDASGSRDNSFYVVVRSEPYAHVPFGTVVAAESPYRPPFTKPKTWIEVVPESNMGEELLNGGVIVGKVVQKAGRLEVAADFIPACCYNNSHPELVKINNSVGNMLSEMATYILSTTQNIHSRSQGTSLVKSYLTFSEKISDFIAGNLGRFNWRMEELPPIALFETLLELAYLTRFTLERLPAKDKEELLLYFSEWSDISTSEISEKISGVLTARYNHNDIGNMTDLTLGFCQMLHTIFARLNALDFIGKKRGERVFVNERVYTPGMDQESKPEVRNEEPPRKGRSFLAD